MTRMLAICQLSIQSLINRRMTAGLTVFAIALSVMLLLGVEKLRKEARSSFANTISGTDLVVGARSGALQLLLYSVFRIGNASNNISWRSYETIKGQPEVAWTIPLSLGDSHRGYRVLGTNLNYFRFYRYRQNQALAFQAGKPFADMFDAVLGADVAVKLGYKVGDGLIVAHGLGSAGFSDHADKPFKVSGILTKTGTPIDRTVHISLAGIEAIHIDWRNGAPVPGLTLTADEVRKMELKPRSITAFLVGLKSRFAIFGMQRRVNEFPREPLLAILPGIALQEMWSLMGTAESALAGITILVVATSILVMLTMLLSSLNERRREMAILRSVGARTSHIFAMFVAEAGALTLAGCVIGLGLVYLGLLIVQPIIDSRYGLFLEIGVPSLRDLTLVGTVFAMGIVAGFIPAWRAYRQSLVDGMIVRV